MKNIILKNPEQAQQIFKNLGWTDKDKYFFQVNSDITEVMLNGEVCSPSLSGNSLNIGFGYAYTILLEEFDNEVILELKEIDGLGALLIINQIPYCLRVFRTSNETQLKKIGDHYPELRIIDFGSGKNESVKDLGGIIACSNLHTLNLAGCREISDFSALSEMRALTNLNLEECWIINSISSLKYLRSLNRLNLSWCPLVTDLNSISKLVELNHLELMFLNISDFSPLTEMKELKNLNLESCENLTDLNAFLGLRKLTNLNLARCNKLIDLTPLSRLTSLKILNLGRCKNINDITPLSELSSLTKLDLSLNPFIRTDNVTNLLPIKELKNLRNLSLAYYNNLSDLTLISGLKKLHTLNLRGCKTITDLSPLSELSALANLNLNRCENITDLSPLSGLSVLTNLDLSNSKKITRIKNICSIENLKEIDLNGCSNIRDFESLTSLPSLEKLEWIDPLACSLILMQTSYNRQDKKYIVANAEKWIREIELSKDAIDYLSKLLGAVSLLKGDNNHQLLTALSTSMRSRGLQSEGINDLDAFTWETWCNQVLKLELPDAVNCLKAVVIDLDIQRETEVLLGPIIIAASELIEKYPSERGDLLDWVNGQLQQLNDYPTEERQIAPSAAVFFASLHMKDVVLFWLTKATDEKVPLWQDKVVLALINYYARKEEFTECRRLLDQIKIEDQKDLAISSIAVAMGEKYPIEAAFLLDDIKELSISTVAAKRLLQNSSVLSTPQGIYQLLLHLQSNTEELSSTITTLIEKDLEGKVAQAVKILFLQKQPAGPSAAVLLELCKHRAISDFVKPRVLEKYKTNLLERVNKECAESIELLLSEMQLEEMIDQEEANELLQLMQQS